MKPVAIKADKYELVGVALRIRQPDYLQDVAIKLKLNEVERNRLEFCFLCFGASSVIWWLNFHFRLAGPIIPDHVKRALDDFFVGLQDRIDELDEESIKLDEYVVDSEEMKLFCAKYNTSSTIETSLATVFKGVIEDRVGLYYNAFDVQIKDAISHKQNPNSYVSIDPVAKVFMQHFNGCWEERVADVLPMSLFLSECHHQIGKHLATRIEFR